MASNSGTGFFTGNFAMSDLAGSPTEALKQTRSSLDCFFLEH